MAVTQSSKEYVLGMRLGQQNKRHSETVRQDQIRARHHEDSLVTSTFMSLTSLSAALTHS
ncbi:hypothetical protein M404DRAFT_994249 [Pisolithus tinctorius Marx 270]|uniref:Uncharacterized protein n=1 Tax=Pisolithus tinctorius Marx 270 TaxID=870435 RepID=A0A0C3PS92_PISTI|nr:hypothetical protein M404DRAFT_994249 [Pisolithus tinctorius Marx 270]